MVNNGSCYAGERIRLQLYLSPVARHERCSCLVYFPLNSTAANRSEDERGAKRGEAVKVPSTYVILTKTTTTRKCASGNAPAEMQLCCIMVKLFAKLEPEWRRATSCEIERSQKLRSVTPV